MNQLPLPFDHAPRYGLDDFMPSASNDDALAAIERWPKDKITLRNRARVIEKNWVD